jgi:hypothetical protein
MNPFLGGYVGNQQKGMSAQNAAMSVVERFGAWKNIFGFKEPSEFMQPMFKETGFTSLVGTGKKEVSRDFFKKTKELETKETDILQDIRKEYIINEKIINKKDFFSSKEWKEYKTDLKKLYGNTLTDEQKESISTRISNIFDNKDVILSKLNNLILTEKDEVKLEKWKEKKKKILHELRIERFKSLPKTIRGEGKEIMEGVINE